jgi:hypothetical protein
MTTCLLIPLETGYVMGEAAFVSSIGSFNVVDCSQMTDILVRHLLDYISHYLPVKEDIPHLAPSLMPLNL